ncbi:hypothetical protein OFC47_27535, partial [Escherichia coli]|nr:hypothetical protein [Escherichia coli]
MGIVGLRGNNGSSRIGIRISSSVIAFPFLIVVFLTTVLIGATFFLGRIILGMILIDYSALRLFFLGRK